MKRHSIIAYSFLLVVLAFAACEDLEVENKNRPKFEETNTPAQVNGSAGSLFNNWYMTAVDYYGPALSLFMGADAGSCSWGNAGMRDFSSQPRQLFNNSPSYPYVSAYEPYYQDMYGTLSSANDVLKAIANAEEGEVEQPLRAQAVAYFIQGTVFGTLGNLYDKGFIVTEETDITQDIEPSPYQDLLDKSIERLDMAIDLCNTNSFDIPASWLPMETAWTNVELAELANTMAARTLAYGSRNAQQDEANDWARIKNYAQNGIKSDFAPVMDDVSWYNLYVMYANWTGWARVDMRIINMLDPDMPAWFPASGDYTELPDNGEATSDDARLASDFQYMTAQDFSPERGEYHFTTYRYKRNDIYLTTWTEPLAYVRKTENDMILAEALIKADNDLVGARAILNDPAGARKVRGQLPDVTTNDRDELLEIIYQEKTIECLQTGEGIEYYDMRRRDMLQEGTPLHLPIPGQQLEVMQMEYYSFGGTTGEPGIDYSTGGWEKNTDMPSY